MAVRIQLLGIPLISALPNKISIGRTLQNELGTSESNLLGIPLLLAFPNKISIGRILQNGLGIVAIRIPFIRDSCDFGIP